LFQNYKRTIKKNSKRVEQKIHFIKEQFLDKTTLLSVFKANPYLGEPIAHIEQADNMRHTPLSKKKATRPIYQDDDEDDSEDEGSNSRSQPTNESIKRNRSFSHSFSR